VLYDPDRHEALETLTWDESRARSAIEWIVRETEAAFVPGKWWPMHPRDVDDEDKGPAFPLYHGALGVIWALDYLDAQGAAQRSRSYAGALTELVPLTRAWLAGFGSTDLASFLMGELPILLHSYGQAPTEEGAARLESLILGNLDHPTRELMWGSPGTMLAALFLHEHTGASRWADLFVKTADKLWSQLLWSEEYGCHYWTQDMYGRTSTYIDSVHGFAGTALSIIRGRHLLPAPRWDAWRDCIANTVAKTATREGRLANWRALLYTPEGQTLRWLMQYCHGAPGFVVCLGDFPGRELDELLLAGSEAVWAAGPLKKGSNLCHGTGGNGYAFLKLFERTGDALWLERARAFAMHGLLQTERDAALHGQLRYSLWTGDPGFAIYLWDCIRGKADLPTVDVFFTGNHANA
jgi:hypothetical protein